ncbi:MAG: SDR family NAD(P)-dependent oxidoreductase [Steroidobacteraceae bacterium]
MALVTGGSRGLGLQIAGALGEAGATVVLSARKQPELDDACGVLCTRGISAHAIAGDASQPDAIERICSTAVAEHGKVDILVNNAGATWPGARYIGQNMSFKRTRCYKGSGFGKDLGQAAVDQCLNTKTILQVTRLEWRTASVNAGVDSAPAQSRLHHEW